MGKSLRKQLKSAFTLAELLITLAIIGIIAALTIPTLIQNYQERAWQTASEVFERKLEESLKVMNSQATLAGYRTTADFVDELSKHMKINKICSNDEITTCFADKVYWGEENEEIDMTKIKTASNFGIDTWGTETVGIQFANGVTGVVAYNPDCRQDPYSNQITGTSCLAILYDTSGFKAPNTSDKDLHGININRLGRSCAFSLNGVCFGKIFLSESITMAECAELKNDLGISKCNTQDKDYWGGVVKTCGGKQYVPSKNQMIEIAKYLYNTDDIVSNNRTENLTVDPERAAQLGLTDLLNGQTIEIWINREAGSMFGSMIADDVIFEPTEFMPNAATSRTNSGNYGMCIIP